MCKYLLEKNCSVDLLYEKFCCIQCWLVTVRSFVNWYGCSLVTQDGLLCYQLTCTELCSFWNPRFVARIVIEYWYISRYSDIERIVVLKKRNCLFVNVISYFLTWRWLSYWIAARSLPSLRTNACMTFMTYDFQIGEFIWPKKKKKKWK